MQEWQSRQLSNSYFCSPRGTLKSSRRLQASIFQDTSSSRQFDSSQARDLIGLESHFNRFHWRSRYRHQFDRLFYQATSLKPKYAVRETLFESAMRHQ
jgi:hypothetical protein